MLRKIAFLFVAVGVLVATAASMAYAEVIKLKNGQEIEASVISRDKEKMVIEVYGVQMMYYFDQVDQVNGKAVEEYVATAPMPGTVPAAEAEEYEAPKLPAPVVEETVVPQQARSVVKDEEDLASIQQSVSDQIKAKGYKLTNPSGSSASVPAPDIEKFMNLIKGPLGIGIVIGILVLILAGYVFCSYCLMLIASKTACAPLWWAWVPIVNLFLMCKIAGLRYTWLFIFFAAIIPFIGGLAVTGFEVYLWWRIAAARNKPGWLGILMMLPFVNLFVMGHLAFSE